MGYYTQFNGKFKLNKKLALEHHHYLNKFSETRRVARNAEIAEKIFDPIRVAAGLPLGEDAKYFVGAAGYAGQRKDSSIINYNQPPKGQPSLWCQWKPSDDGQYIIWDQSDIFFNYVEWINYLIDNFLSVWEYSITGNVKWQGEKSTDVGKIKILDNKVEILSLDILV